MTEDSSGPQISGEPTTININAGPQVMGGQMQSTNAVAGLVLAILGLLTFLSGAAFACCGPSLCFTIPAMFLVSTDKKNIGGTYHPDRGMITASNVINIISLVLALIGIAFYLVVLLLFGGLASLGA